MSRTETNTELQTSRQEPSEPASGVRQLRQPPADVQETADAYRVFMDIPGVSAESLQIEVDRNELTISGTPNYEQPEGAKLLHAEFASAAFQRSFLLPTEIDRDGITATAVGGVVTLTLPKQQPSVRRINVSAD